MTDRTFAVCPTCEHIAEVPVVGKPRLVLALDREQLRTHAHCNLRGLYIALSAAARNLPYDGLCPGEHRP